MLAVTCMILFIYGYFSKTINEITLLLDLILELIILSLIVTIYFAYERREGAKSGLVKLAVLPYKFEEVVVWTGYISLIALVLVAILAPWHLLLVTGFQFLVAGFILSYLFFNNPGSVVRERKKNADNGQEYPSYQLTQLNYTFLYTIVGLSLIIAGIVLGIARFQA